MTHVAELSLHQYMNDAVKGKSTMSEEVIEQVGKDVMDALKRQFNSGKSRGDFTLRMSNIGKPTCQLWFEKNKPELAEPKPSNFLMNMMLGDIVEAVFKGLLKAAEVQYKDSEKVTLKTKEQDINGSYDLIINGAVDDVKSASDWSYRNKFESFETLSSGDAFGYVAQLAGYAKATNTKAGGWWAVNKTNGKFKYVSAENLDMKKELSKIDKTIETVNKNKFKRCFEPVPETFRGKETGNTVLNDGCKFCSYRFDCWDKLEERPSVMSKAKVPPMIAYVGDVIAA